MEALNSKERKFAEENHGLIYSFLNYYRLTEAEHYDICAIAYLQAVKEWHRKPELRDKYKFSTIAFKKMESAKIKKYHADRLRDSYILFSLNDLNAEGNEYLGQIADQRDAIREIEDQQNIEDLLNEVTSAYGAAAEAPYEDGKRRNARRNYAGRPYGNNGILERQRAHKKGSIRSFCAGGGGIEAWGGRVLLSY